MTHTTYDIKHLLIPGLVLIVLFALAGAVARPKPDNSYIEIYPATYTADELTEMGNGDG